MITLTYNPEEYITVSEMLIHLKLDAVEAEENSYITALIGAAVNTIANDINREILPNNQTATGDAVLMNNAFKLAAFLLVATWYENRESVAVGVSVAELPLAYHALIRPYRIHLSGIV